MKWIMLSLLVLLAGCGPSKEQVLYQEVLNCMRGGYASAYVEINEYFTNSKGAGFYVYPVTCVNKEKEEGL
jgi:hypothetical protein